MRIRWTYAAAEDLEHIKDYLTELQRNLESGQATEPTYCPAGLYFAKQRSQRS